MRFKSTRGDRPTVSFREALLDGIAPDGGLYVPVDWPHLTRDELVAWAGLPFTDLAVRLAGRLLDGEFEPAVIDRLVRSSLDFPVPVVPVGHHRWILELFHGPTLAFKDFGARFLARFFGHLLAERGDHATILVATSGDTGSAVAQGFFGVPRVRVVVLYPAGRVSPFQEAQMATLGGNVTALRVPGTFDDCQRLVKAAFLDPACRPLNLSSANSINIGRLLPQTFYYVASALAVAPQLDRPLVFAVPSGNLGNLTAGVLAGRLGLPVAKFVAGSNINDVLPEYLRTAVYRARPAVATLSNAMDVGDPSNFARLAMLAGSSHPSMAAEIRGETISEEETRAAIASLYRRSRYVIDPHGAVAWAAANHAVDVTSGRDTIVLATAHPAKFSVPISEQLGFVPPLPDRYRDWSSRPLQVIDLPDVSDAVFTRFLHDLAR